jgi:hypothetical protein
MKKRYLYSGYPLPSSHGKNQVQKQNGETTKHIDEILRVLVALKERKRRKEAPHVVVAQW